MQLASALGLQSAEHVSLPCTPVEGSSVGSVCAPPPAQNHLCTWYVQNWCVRANDCYCDDDDDRHLIVSC